MNYIVNTILVGILFFFIFFNLTLNSRISINCCMNDKFTIIPSIFYVLIANLLGPLYLIYYFFYRSTYIGHSCYCKR